MDPALVLHYFGSKDRLFAAAVEWPIDLDEVASGVLAPGPDGLGERLVRLLVERWEDERTREPLAAVIRSAVGQGESAQMTREFMRREVLARLAGFLPGPTAELRVSLVAGTLAGLAITRYIMRVEPIASLPADDVVRAVGPTVQRYLTGDIA